MTPDNTQRSVLLIGKSQLVLDESVAGLRELGYEAQATNDFADVTSRFDVRNVDLVVFGGQVPPGLKAELTEQMAAINPRIIFVQGLAGIPGLIVNQVRGAFAAADQDVTYTPGDRSLRLTLAGPADVKVTLWWQTAFVPPDPRSDSLLLVHERLAGGEHVLRVPGHIPSQAAFATVQVDAAIYAFSIATEQ
jgi:hypothetical protein